MRQKCPLQQMCRGSTPALFSKGWWDWPQIFRRFYMIVWCLAFMFIKWLLFASLWSLSYNILIICLTDFMLRKLYTQLPVPFLKKKLWILVTICSVGKLNFWQNTLYLMDALVRRIHLRIYGKSIWMFFSNKKT